MHSWAVQATRLRLRRLTCRQQRRCCCWTAGPHRLRPCSKEGEEGKRRAVSGRLASRTQVRVMQRNRPSPSFVLAAVAAADSPVVIAAAALFVSFLFTHGWIHVNVKAEREWTNSSKWSPTHSRAFSDVVAAGRQAGKAIFRPARASVSAGQIFGSDARDRARAVVAVRQFGAECEREKERMADGSYNERFAVGSREQ